MLQGRDMRALAALLLAISTALAAAGSAAAVPRTWAPTSGTSWHTDANWSPAGVPDADDRAVIASGTPEVSASDAAVGSIEIGAGGLLISDGRRLAIGSVEPSSW